MPSNQFRIAIISSLLCLPTRAGIAAEQAGDFEKSVARVLIRNCVSCHNSSNPKGKLDLTRRESLIKGGENGPAIVPGNAANSYLIERVADGSMPPNKHGQKIPKGVLTSLRRWVNNGAKWPKDRQLSPFELTTQKRAGFDWWSFQPVKRPAIPAVQNQQWLRNPVDAFVLNRLEQNRLSPAPNADRLTLFRRLKFDLVGLPPTPEEIGDFLKDRSPSAYENAVDRFLASPHYGERWGRHWLDVVRFGESDGFEHDKLRPHAWPYRDYVIRSFNQNKSYDLFVTEQLAGDVLQPVTTDGIAATGFFVAGPWDEVQNVAASQIERRRAREEEMEELITAVSQSFLGVTVNCARCHDHKFDPVLQTDYYRMKSVFAGVRHAKGRTPGHRPLLTSRELKLRAARLLPLQKRISAIQTELAKLDSHIASDAVANKSVKNALIAGQFGNALNARSTGFTAKSKTGFQSPPLTVECWVRVKNANQFNVFVANNLKSSGGHWELYSFSGKGDFSAYLPGLSPATLRSGIVITDDKWHYLAMQFDNKRVRLFVDGKLVKDQPVKRVKPIGAVGSLYLGGYSPVNIGCDGTVDEVRISHGIRPIVGIPKLPFQLDSSTAGLWHFDKSQNGRIPDIAIHDQQIDKKQIAQQRAILLIKKKKLEAQIASMELQFAYVGYRQKPPATHVLIRGNPEQPGAPVIPGGLSGIRQLSPNFNLKSDNSDGARRIKFAKWVTHPRNPLTARVMVNRLWQYHFGQGLVKTPSDFGFNGGLPTHPQLLDWLADELVTTGWNLKQIQRLILTSATFRQSSRFRESAARIDASNRLLWRFSPRRLEGEIIRDSMLAVSGELNSKLEGPSFRPFTVSVFNTSFYHLFDSDKPEFNRRTIYRIQVSTGRSAFLDALDCPSPSLASPKRRTTTTPLQALALMNNTFAVRQANRFASRVRIRSGERINKQVTLAFQVAYGRAPSKTELPEATDFVRKNGLKSLCWVLLNSSEFLYVR
jgi:hypothetical protein